MLTPRLSLDVTPAGWGAAGAEQPGASTRAASKGLAIPQVPANQRMTRALAARVTEAQAAGAQAVQMDLDPGAQLAQQEPVTDDDEDVILLQVSIHCMAVTWMQGSI